MIHKLSTALLLSSCAMFLIHLPASADWRSQDVYSTQPTDYSRRENSTRRNRNRLSNICKSAPKSDYDISSLSPEVLDAIDDLDDKINNSAKCVLANVNYNGSVTSVIIYKDRIRWAKQDEINFRSGNSRSFGRFITYSILN